MATFQKRGNKWRAIVRKSGHRPLSKSFDTKVVAKNWAREQEWNIDYAAFTDPKKLKAITVGYLIDRFIREFEPGRTKKGSLKILKIGLGSYHLLELTPSDIVDHCKRRRNRDKVSPATQAQDIGFLAEVLRTARAYWKIPFHGDPVADARMVLNKLHLIGRPGERKRRPTPDELNRLHKHWRDNPRQKIPMHDIIDFAVASAWRLGEICRVTWSDLDTKHRTIIIRDRKDPREKIGNDQKVPLLGKAWTIIKRQSKDDDRIFPYSERSVSTAFTRACQKLKIEDLHLHDLRHEGTSRLFEDGYVIQEVALCTGHKDWKMLARYTQLKAKDLHRDTSE